MVARLRKGLAPTSPRRWDAVINNPLTVQYANEPVGIRVFFYQGECPAATYLRVRNPAGTAVNFQWEPAAHTLTEANMGTWPGGSLRHGTLWVVVPSLAAGETQRWTVELYDAAQSYSPVQLVTYTVTDASNEKLETAGVSLNFQSTVGWMLQSMIDRTVAGEMVSTATGLTMRIRATLAGGEKLSSTAAHITGSARQRNGTSNTGYGVAYQEFEASWTWVDSPWTTRVRYRLWANGRVTMQSRTVANSSSTSEQKYLFLNISANNTGLTAVGDDNNGRKTFEYSDRRMVCGFRYLTSDYEGKTTETHGTNWSTSVAANRMYGGWIGTTTIPTAAYWLQACFLALYATDAGEAEWQRGMNPLMTTAARFSPAAVRGYLAGFVRRYIEAWLPYSTDTDKKGLEGAMRVLLGDLNGSGYSASAALTKFNEYTTSVAITPTSAASWHSVWNAGQGMNFITKNGEAIPYILRRAIDSGDTTTKATCEAILRALADFVVLAEATSGGDGNFKLDGTDTDNFNAEASAMALLAQALAYFGKDATWQACYQRLFDRYATGNFAGGTRRGYRIQNFGSLPNDVVKLPQSTYDSYQNYELSRALQEWPVGGNRTVPDMRQYLYEITGASFMPEDRLYQGQLTRRGLTNTTLHWVFTLARYGNDSDWSAIGLILMQSDAQLRPKNGQKHPQYGYSGTDVTMLNVMGDIRACADVLRLIA